VREFARQPGETSATSVTIAQRRESHGREQTKGARGKVVRLVLSLQSGLAPLEHSAKSKAVGYSASLTIPSARVPVAVRGRNDWSRISPVSSRGHKTNSQSQEPVFIS